MVMAAPAGSLEWYVASHMWWHIRGAMGELPPAKALLDHQDRAILEAVAIAMGRERIDAVSSAWEADGDFGGAAKLCWIGHMLRARGVFGMSEEIDYIFRAAELLVSADSDELVVLELEVLHKATYYEQGTERSNKAKARLKELAAAQPATFESKISECMASWINAFAPMGMMGDLDPRFKGRHIYPNPTSEHLDESLDAALACSQTFMEASALTDDPIRKHYCVYFHSLLFTMFGAHTHSEKFCPEKHGAGEATMTEAIEAYDYHKVSASTAACSC